MNLQKESIEPKTPLGQVPIRWHWMASSGAVLGAVAASNSMAGVRQITLSANQITSGGANTLSADVTGDGVSDLPFLLSSTTQSRVTTSTTSGYYYYQFVNFASVYSSGPGVFKYLGWARYRVAFTSTTASSSRIASATNYAATAASGGFTTGSTPVSATGLTAITFTDARINGGAPTQGFVNTRAFNTDQMTHTVQLVRTIFNDANTMVPPGINPNVTYREFDPTIYAQRAQLGNKIKKLNKKAKKLKKKNKSKAKKLKKKAKKLSKKLAALA